MKTIGILLITLHTATAEWHPVPDRMLTQWGKSLAPDKVWSEHPRPQLVRESWSNLNGFWNHAIRPKDSAQPDAWDGKILVPFAPEAALSGVGRLLEPDQSLWYQRDLPIKPIAGERTLLHFEAVDYQTTVWVNGTEIGSHTGGHTPFSFDITDALKPDGNQLVVRVLDATEGYQLHGKQKLKPGGIWYTRVSGIWQTVWLEQVPARHVGDLDFSCDIKSGTLRVMAKIAGLPSEGERIRVTASIDGRQVAEGTSASNTAELKIPEPKLWSPESPNLYDLDVKLTDAAGKTIDSVKSYAALREFGKTRDAKGNLRFTLNGKPLFHWGPLDQGWWPDGLLTPPSDEAMLSDIRFLKDAGFNMIRKHIKVEPRRYYHHCDRLGMLMWQDQVSAGYGKGANTPPWTRMKPGPQDAEWPEDAHRQWLLEYQRMVGHLRDTACIAAWIPFNEAWGQHRSMEIGKMAAALDPTRHVNIASGGNFWPVGDVADHHNYPNPEFPLDDVRFNDYIKVVGEFGGHGWPVEGHLWNKSAKNWGYGGLPQSLDEWKQRYARSIDILCDLRRRGVAAGVYTQTSDVENEINGLLTYDRIPKIDAAWLKQQSDRLLATPDAGQ
jgi:beta-galactosidase